MQDEEDKDLSLGLSPEKLGARFAHHNNGRRFIKCSQGRYEAQVLTESYTSNRNFEKSKKPKVADTSLMSGNRIVVLRAI